MNKKKLLIIIGLIIIFFLVLFVFLKNKKKPEEIQITPVVPSIPRNYKGQLSFSIDISEKDFNFPEILPLIEITKKSITKEKIVEIVRNLNFTGEPITANDTLDGLTYFWKNVDSTVFAFPDSGTIRYNSSLPIETINKQLSDNEITSISENFFYNNSFTERESLKLKEIKYLKQDLNTEILKETAKENANIYECIFSPMILDYEINLSWTDLPLVFVQTLKDGSIHSAQFTNLDQAKNSESSYKIKKFQEFKDTINNASIVSVKNAQLALSDLSKESIDNIEINKVEIIYLQDLTKSMYLQPVFKIQGTTSITGFGNGIEVVLYLPAISQN